MLAVELVEQSKSRSTLMETKQVHELRGKRITDILCIAIRILEQIEKRLELSRAKDLDLLCQFEQLASQNLSIEHGRDQSVLPLIKRRRQAANSFKRENVISRVIDSLG
jgi:hypothetical protein